MRERKSKPIRKPGPGYEWVRCRTCEGFGEIIGRWNQVLGGARTRCPTCFRLGWIEHWIADSTGRRPGKEDPQPEGDGLPEFGGELRSDSSTGREKNEGPTHGEPEVAEVHHPGEREGRSRHGHGGPRSARRPRATYHYARSRANTTLCELPSGTRGDRERRERSESSLLEIGDPLPAGGQLCVICEAVSIGSVAQPPRREDRDAGIEGDQESPGARGSGDRTLEKRTGVTFHYEKAGSRLTLCDIATERSGGQGQTGSDDPPQLLEPGFSVPAGGKLCLVCATTYQGTREGKFNPKLPVAKDPGAQGVKLPSDAAGSSNQPGSRKVFYHYAQTHSPFTMCGIRRTHPGDLKWRGREISPLAVEVGASLPPNGEICSDCTFAYAQGRHQPQVRPSQKPSSSRPGSGKTVAAILAFVALGAAVVALLAVFGNREGTDDRPENPIVVAATSTPRTSIVPSTTASPAESSDPASHSLDSTRSTTTLTPKPDLRFLEEKQYMLELINAERARAGLAPVALGDNIAAQLHAEAALENCFSSHWGIDGLKPYMRYSLAGGYQSNGANISGLSYCIRPSDGYRLNGTVEQEIREAMDGLMESPGHRDNVLDRWHRKVNIGLAWDRYNFSLVQHFEGDYVKYDRVPEIENGVLRLSGTTRNGATFRSDEDLGVQIYFDPPPQALTPGQVSRTYCYDQGRLIGALRPPLSGDWYYYEDGFNESHQPCPDPYGVSPEASAPLSHDEAHKYWEEAYQASVTAPVEQLRVPWITASEMTARDQFFSVTANLVGLLDDHGDGVYTIILWGGIDGEHVVISQYSIFHGIVSPENHHSTDQAGFATVSAGSYHTCGVKTDGAVACWGRDSGGESTPPDGSFISVSVSGPVPGNQHHSCGVKTDGSVECWGWDAFGQSTPPNESFLSVSAGVFHTCGVKADGSVECWGSNQQGQSIPPDGSFISVSAGVFHTCGVKTDGSVECWGSNIEAQTVSAPPDGPFTSVSAGFDHSCGVKTDGSVGCWGNNTRGQSTPPEGSLISVSAGVGRSCGVKPNGSVECWGSGYGVQLTPPGGSFVSVSAGFDHSCGVKTDGSVECWGSDSHGQSTPPQSATSTR